MRVLFKKSIFYLITILVVILGLNLVWGEATEQNTLAPYSFFSGKERINISKKAVAFLFDTTVLSGDIEIESRANGNKLLKVPPDYTITDMIVGPLKKQESIISYGFASCTAIIIKGKHRKSGRNIFALVHLFPDNFIRDFDAIMNTLINLGIEIFNFGAFTKIYPEANKSNLTSPEEQRLALDFKTLRIAPDLYPELFSSKKFKGVFIARHPGFFKRLIVSSKQVTAVSGAYKKAKLNLKWNQIRSLDQSISKEKKNFNILSRIFSFLHTRA